MRCIEQFAGEKHASLLSHPDPVVLELNRLQNQLKEKEMEMRKAQSEIRALRATEVLKDKALEELRSQARRLEEKLKSSDYHLEQKNLDIKKLRDEKKEALSGQYAAEATLRRVYANQKNDDIIPVELVIAPIEAELKIRKSEVAALQDDKRTLERLTKSKEAALLEAERILTSGLERALVVEEVQNQNFELRRQIEICQEENKILVKTNRQKVSEVEKLSQTINLLEEAILAGGAASNTIRDYERQISQLNDEKRSLERELARMKVSVNRVAKVVANEWKDENDKVMPVKQWLQERRLLQAEMQKLKDKLAISERAAKTEAQAKEKLKLRLKTLEEGLKNASSFSINTDGSPKNGKPINFFGILSINAGTKKRSTITESTMQMLDEKHASEMKLINNLKKKSLWSSQNKIIDDSGKENAEMNKNSMVDDKTQNRDEITEMGNSKGIITASNKETKGLEVDGIGCEDTVSGVLYDRVQKEVIHLRKSSELKDNILHSKDEEIKMLMKRIGTLTRAIKVEAKKAKREAAIREKDSALAKLDEKIRSTNSSKRLPLSSS